MKIIRGTIREGNYCITRCPYGIDARVGSNGCQDCRYCKGHKDMRTNPPEFAIDVECTFDEK
jgi:hypothetical protein